jgi:hypothetical protein
LRVQLIAALALGLATSVSRPAAGQHRATADVDVYADEHITVVSPGVRLSADVGGMATVDATYVVDILSGATHVLTADAVSTATRFSEERHEAHFGVSGRPTPEVRFGAAYTLSHEDDFQTHAVRLDGSTELLERMAELSLSYSLSLESVGMVTDPEFSEGATTHSVDLAWRHILGRHTAGSIVVSGALALCGEDLGCHANPYRFVRVRPLSGGASIALRERNPDERLRGAVGVRLSHDFGSGLAVHLGYRFYGDSWDITGHTASLSTALGLFGERLVLRADGRASWQGAASFYEDTYVAPTAVGLGPEWRTADRELTELVGLMAGLRAEGALLAVGPLLRLGVHVRVAHLWYWYHDHSEQPGRSAWMLGGGIHAEM